MILTYENLLSLSDFNLKPCNAFKKLNTCNFLSFQDALHYLIKAFTLEGKKVLVPAFYCEATIHDMEKHGLQVQLCGIDHKKFDIDLTDFKTKLRMEQPDIIIIYNFFGKNSVLYSDVEWRKLLKPDVVLISDFAHSLVPNHSIEFFNNQHFYIDSTRKTTCRMMAHLIMPEGIKINRRLIKQYSPFKYAMRSLFFLKNWCLKVATIFNSKFLADLGMWFYLRHDKYIGSSKYAYTGLWWDNFLYNHINFKRIKNHRLMLYQKYQQIFKDLTSRDFIETFDLPVQETANICFFFVKILQQKHIMPVIKLLQESGFWADVLWDFDAIKDISPLDRDWAKSIIVLPYTVNTQAEHINKMASLMEEFFNAK